MKEIKRIWYCSITETIYKEYPKIRLTDSQLAKLIADQFDGEESMHLANIRRSRCNDKRQEYVDASFINGVWIKNK